MTILTEALPKYPVLNRIPLSQDPVFQNSCYLFKKLIWNHLACLVFSFLFLPSLPFPSFLLPLFLFFYLFISLWPITLSFIFLGCQCHPLGPELPQDISSSQVWTLSVLYTALPRLRQSRTQPSYALNKYLLLLYSFPDSNLSLFQWPLSNSITEFFLLNATFTM